MIGPNDFLIVALAPENAEIGFFIACLALCRVAGIDRTLPSSMHSQRGVSRCMKTS